MAQIDKEEAAMIYDTFDMRIDRHWTDKKVGICSSPHLGSEHSLQYSVQHFLMNFDVSSNSWRR